MVKRGQQLARRTARRTSGFASRRFQPQVQRQLVKRERLFVREEEKQRALVQKEKEQVNKLVTDINAGRISNINQIPEKYRSLIGVTQSDLNKIQQYYAAKREADLWASAFKLADKVISSTNPAAIFSIAFSDNPYAKEAYRIRNAEYKAYQERRKIITDIRAGKYTDVAIVGGRIIDTKSGVPITPSKVNDRQYAELVQKELPKGEKILVDPRTSKITAINSSILGKKIPFTKTSITNYQKQLSSVQGQSLIPSQKKKRTSFKEIAKFIFTGTTPREQRFLKEQEVITKRIESFNKAYGNKTLSPETYKIAQKTSNDIQIKQNDLNRRWNNYGKTFIGKIRGKFGERIATPGEIEVNVKKNVPKLEREIKNLQQELSKAQSKGKRNRIQSKIRFNKKEIERIKQGRPIELIASPVPFAPVATIPKGVTKIKFIGSQKKLKDGKIVSDIVFQTSKGEIGYARGVQVTKGSQGQSLVLGKFGQKGVQFPTNLKKISKVKSFVGTERTITKPQTISIARKVQLATPKGIKPITLVKKNIDIMAQGGVGRVITIKGKKFFRIMATPFGKLKRVPGKVLSVDDFASISASITKKDLSLIVGKSITQKGAKAQFIGIVKGIKDIKKFDLTSGGASQYTTALNKVVATTASALAKAEKVKGVPKAVKLVATAEIIQRATKGKPTTTAQVQKITQQIITKPTITQVQKAKQIAVPLRRTRTIPKTKQTIKVNQKQLQKLNNKLKNKLAQKVQITQREAQALKQALKLRLTQKQVQQLVTLGGITIPRVVPTAKLPLIVGIKLGKGFGKKKLKKAVPVYYVVIKIKGKKVNLTPRPLRLKEAKDFLAYRLDNGLSRTAWFEPLGKSKIIITLPRRMRGYFSKVSKKLRPFRIRVGRKRALRNGYIEKRKYISDTKGEKRALKRRRKKRRVVKKRKPKMKVKRNSKIRKRKSRKGRVVVRRKHSGSVLSRKRLKKRRPVKRKTRLKRKPVRKLRKKRTKRPTRKPRRRKTPRRVRRTPRKRKKQIRRKPRRRLIKKKRRKNGTKKRRV